jgi:hypothetical protein
VRDTAGLANPFGSVVRIVTRMEESVADLSDDDYEDINSGGGFSSSDTKSRCQSEDISTRPQSVLNAPDPAYAAVPVQFYRNTE